MASADDRGLVRQFQAGQESAFDTLVLRHQRFAYNVAFRLVRDADAAWDLAQESFVRAYRALPSFRGRAQFRTWLYRIVANLCFNYRRRAQYRREVQPGPGVLDCVASPGPTPVDEERTRRLRAAIDEAVAALPPRQRAVFTMQYYEEMKQAEIAEALGCSVGAVKAHYFHAVQKLKDRLADWVGR